MAETSTTTFMSLTLPTPGERLGPTWASDINTALTSIDAHDHSSGKGAQVGIAGITIDGSFDFEKSTTTYPAINMKYLNLKKENNPSTTFSPSTGNFLNSLISGGTTGDLYWNNANNQQIQITSGANVNVTGVTVNTFALNATAITGSTFAITESNLKSVYKANYAGALAITLPTIGSSSTQSSDGRIYIIKDISGAAGTNNITIHRASTDTIDGATTAVISSDHGSLTLVADESSSRWLIV